MYVNVMVGLARWLCGLADSPLPANHHQLGKKQRLCVTQPRASEANQNQNINSRKKTQTSAVEAHDKEYSNPFVNISITDCRLNKASRWSGVTNHHEVGWLAGAFESTN